MPQGNRSLSGYRSRTFFEVGVVPVSGEPFVVDADFQGGFVFQQAQCGASEDTEVGVGVAFADAALIFTERDIELPMQAVLDRPMVNNTAERALRPAVIYRKLSFGTQSETGIRFIERMLTVSETCRLQDRSAYEYLIAAVTAHFSKQTPPSLLPTL